MKKKIISLCLLYCMQFFISCTCHCEPVVDYEETYISIELQAWDTSGFQSSQISGKVNKNSFGLSFYLETELKEVIALLPKVNLNSFGFASAYALSCDCIGGEYINVDPVKAITITVMNTENQEVIEVTDSFKTYDYNGEYVPLSQFFEVDTDYWSSSFQVDMVNYDTIPDASIFTVIITLESGIEFVEQTEQIVFN